MNNHFAHIYDALTYDVPDDLWVDIIQHFARDKTSILDIGCGTGRILNALDLKEKYGFDSSHSMIDIASEKYPDLNLSTQNMKDFKFDRRFDLVTATSDVVNYLENIDELQALIERVSHYLEPDGILIFDSHSVYKMITEFNDVTYADDVEDISYIWFAHRGEAPYSVDHELIFFHKENDGRYQKTTETFSQRTYPHEEIVNMIQSTALELVQTFSDFDPDNGVNEACDRIFYILRKTKKINKFHK